MYQWCCCKAREDHGKVNYHHKMENYMYQGSYRPYFDKGSKEKFSDNDSLKTESDEIGDQVALLRKLKDHPSQFYELVQDRPHYILPHELNF